MCYYQGSRYNEFSNEYSASVAIPDSVTYNGEIYSVTSIDEYAFYKCTSLTNVTIGNSVASIGNNAFYSCSGLTSITIGNSVTSIGELAFRSCSALKSVTIPNSVTSIENGAFYDCSGLTSVTTGNSVTNIGGGAFENCSGLASVYVLGNIPPTVGSNNFTTEEYLNIQLYVSKGTLATYQTADTWKEFSNIQEFDVTGINEIEENTPVIEYTADGVVLTNAIGKNIAVYIASGSQIINTTSYDGENITLDKGVYIIVVNGKSVKIIVK